MRRIGYATLLLAAMVSAHAASQQPTRPVNQPSPQAQQPQAQPQLAKEDKRGTEEMPLVIKKDAEEVERESSDNEKERHQRARTDTFIIAISGATALILIIQAIVFGFQASRLRQSVNAMKEATALTRTEFISTHRPRLIVRQITVDEIGQRGLASGETRIDFTIANVGNTPARIVAQSMRLWTDQTSSDLRDTLRFTGAPHYAAASSEDQAEIGAGEHISRRHVDARFPYADFLLLDDERPDGREFALLGYIDYESAAGIRRRTAICRIFDWELRRFRPVQDPDYEYQD